MNKMRQLELNEEAIKLIAEALSDKIAMWRDHNEVLAMHGVDDIVQKYLDINNVKIGKLQTLLNYLNSL